jgi:hypothetical protein
MTTKKPRLNPHYGNPQDYNGLAGFLRQPAPTNQEVGCFTLRSIIDDRTQTVISSRQPLYGGYRLVDKTMDARRRAELDKELEDAKQNYENAVQQVIRPIEQPKWAADKQASIDEKLDTLFELSKEANMLGQGANMALSIWPALAFGSGYLTYNMMNSRRQSKLLEKAIRQRQRSQINNEPLYAFPDYRPINQPAPVEPTSIGEEEEQALTATAA